MRNNIIMAMLAMANTAQSAIKPSQDLCHGTWREENGNSYCRQVQRVTYENVGTMGKHTQYNETTYMDQQTGECKVAPKQFSGPLAPFNEPLSLHFRGPLNLKQVAVYMPRAPDNKTSGSRSNRDAGLSEAALHLHREQRRASPMGHYHEPLVKGSKDETQWVPPIIDKWKHTRSKPHVVYTTWPTSYTRHLPIGKIPGPPTSRTMLERRDATTTVTVCSTATVFDGLNTISSADFETVTTTETLTTTVTLNDGQGSSSVPTPTPSMTTCTLISNTSSLTSVASGATGTSTATTSLQSSLAVPSSSSLMPGTLLSAPGSESSTTSTLSRPSVTPFSSSTTNTSSRSKCNRTTASPPPSSSPTSGPGSSTGSNTSTYSVVPISGPEPSASPISNPSGGSPLTQQFVRTGYYNAAQQKAEGLMFLGNYGGQKSGRWTKAFGNTLSYLNEDGTGGAAGPTILKDTLLLSFHEATLVTDQPCDDSCGYVQPGSVAYKGFPGPSKIFLLEFSMPHNTTSPTNNSTTLGNDMPAIWLLNARIPYTAQYDKCNCWSSGCGEIDVFEVLAPGDTKVTTTIRAQSLYQGSDANYFARPVDVDRPIRVAVVLDGERGTVSVIILPGGGDNMKQGGEFPGVLGAGEVARWVDVDGKGDGDDKEGRGSLYGLVH